ncbi:MAG: dihydropteroate synthase [Nitrososphaera sp.]|jgi:dihydropteroate synthase
MNYLGKIRVGGSNPVRIMGIINTSIESFYKKSIYTNRTSIGKIAKQMEEDGADFIDVGGMSTAPYLNTVITEKKEIERITNAINAIQKVSKLPISVDTCRAGVAKAALDLDVEIINDISGLKYDAQMPSILSEYQPSVIICAYSKGLVRGNHIVQTKKLIKQSITIAKNAGIPKSKIVIDPAIGFFRKNGKGKFFTKIDSDWLQRDLLILQNLDLIKDTYPLLISVSRKSFLGELLNEPNPEKRLYGSLAAESFAILKGADVIRTHNVKETREIALVTEKLM